MKTIKNIRINSFPKRTEEDTIGEELITKIKRIMDENEPLTDGAPLIYTPKENGVVPEYNIRTDKWEIAMGAMDRISDYKLSEYMKKTDVQPGDEGNQKSENSKDDNSKPANTMNDNIQSA